MLWYEVFVYVLVLGIFAFIVGLLVVFLPNAVRNWPHKRYHYDSPAPANYKSNVDTNDDDNGSVVDKQKAVNSFNT